MMVVFKATIYSNLIFPICKKMSIYFFSILYLIDTEKYINIFLNVTTVNKKIQRFTNPLWFYFEIINKCLHILNYCNLAENMK